MKPGDKPLVIVNADDLAISDHVNDAIFDLMARGRVSSATIIANGPAFERAAAGTADFERCSFGVHLNLTQFEPLTAGADGAALLDPATGAMSRFNEIRSAGLPLLRGAYRELCAQVERVLAAGVAISHFDSHNHVHTRPQFFPVLKALQRRYGIRRVRLSKNVYGPGQPFSRALGWKKSAWNAALRGVYRTTTTDAFTEFLTYLAVDWEATPQYRTIELMVHPGAPYADSETRELEGGWLAQYSAELITYKALRAGE